MAYRYHHDDFEWVYPSRPLHLLNWWREIDLLCKTAVDVPNSHFRPEWVDKPDNFIIITQDGRLVGVVHSDRSAKSVTGHIAITPDFQRSNAGLLLTTKALQRCFYAWRIGKVFCDIGKTNKRAQYLAASLGFKRVAVYNNRIKYKLSWRDYEQRETSV